MTKETKNWSEQSIYLLRTTQQHHVHLSLMADHKANMLIGAAFVVFSIAISQTRSGAELSLSMLTLGITAGISALLAAMAVIPNIGGGSGQDKKGANLLFFGIFSQMTERDYSDALAAQLTSDDAVYRAMVRDIYQMGQVLAKKKYRYLRWSYTIFIAGIVATVTLFAAENLIAL